MAQEPRGGDKWAAARLAQKKAKKTTPVELKALFDAFKSNGGNLYAAAKASGLKYSIARYYIKKAADPKYAQKKEIPPEIAQNSWIRQSAFDMKLNDLIEMAFQEIEEKLKTASLPDIVKAQRELLSLRRYVMMVPLTSREKAKVKEDENTKPPEPEEDVSALLARAAARKAKEKSLPLGDTTPDAPIEEAPAGM